MTTPDPPAKDPRAVQRGKARMQQILAQGEDRFREFQQRAARRSNAVQQADPERLRLNRQRAYQACVEKHGIDVATARVRAAQEARRQYRLDHPTPGEAALRSVLKELGYRIVLVRDPDVYQSSHDDSYDALIEAPIGNYSVDALLPNVPLAIEIDGYYHQHRRPHDHQRDAMLASLGIPTLRLADTEMQDLASVRARIAALLSGD